MLFKAPPKDFLPFEVKSMNPSAMDTVSLTAFSLLLTNPATITGLTSELPVYQVESDVVDSKVDVV